MIEHPNLHEYIHGHRLRPPEPLRGLKTDCNPTLQEQGIDVDDLMHKHRKEIERMRCRTSTGKDTSQSTGMRSTDSAHQTHDTSPRTCRQKPKK